MFTTLIGPFIKQRFEYSVYRLLLPFFLIFQARNRVSEMLNKAIIYYRDDIDLQNVIDFGQKEVSLTFVPFDLRKTLHT